MNKILKILGLVAVLMVVGSALGAIESSVMPKQHQKIESFKEIYLYLSVTDER